MTELIICHHHQAIEQQGQGISQGNIRAASYWIIGGSSAVSNHISKCVACQRLRGVPQEQNMADLPEHQLQPTPPFTVSAID